MKRPLVVVACLLLAGAGIFAAGKAVPLVRQALELERHSQQASLREPAARADWQKEFGDPNTALGAFPRSPDSEKAVRLIDLARKVGINLARPKRSEKVPGKTAEEGDLSAAIGEYCRSELGEIRGPVKPPPETVRLFLDGHAREVGDIVDLLATPEPMAWAMHTGLGPEAPIPNLLGQLRLQRLLVAAALAGARGQASPRILRASWNLNSTLRDRPEVISQLIAIGIARMQTGLARKLPIDPAEWRARLGEHDYRQSLMRAMEVEAIGQLRALPAGSSHFERATRADFLDLRRSFLVALRDSPVLDGTAGASVASGQLDREPHSAGEILASMAGPNLRNAIRRADRLSVDAELTDRVLHANLLRAAAGRWPTEVSGLESSRMPGGHWVYAVSADGRMTISFSRELRWDDKGIMLPSRYESE